MKTLFIGDIVGIVTAIVTISSIVAAITPTPKDDVWIGKLYKLIIKNVSDSKHYFGSDLFSKSIFTRKIQLTRESKKAVEIKGIIYEVELWPNEELEWWFVPIKTGTFSDLECRIKDNKTKLNHAEMGMQGKIIIK